MDESVLIDASRRLLDARRERQVIAPLLSAAASFVVDDAYRVAKLNHDALIAVGESAVGRKIGFTNRGIWNEYKVYQPIWAHMYASTVRDADVSEGRVPAGHFCQPRIEPEIIVKFGKAPAVADPHAIADCVECVAHGFEVVDTHFAGWKFAAADTVADFGLHGALFVGERVDSSRIPNLVSTLSTFRIELWRDDALVDRGAGSNVLDGPLHAIAHLMRVLAAQRLFPPLAAGEIVTTGTLTAAWPVDAGQRWYTRLYGVGLPGLALRFE